MDYGNPFYTDINQCFCRCEYVREIDHTSEKVGTVLSNHVSSLLAQQNHMVHLRNDIATRGVGRISLPITKQSSPLGNASPGMNFLQVFISFT